MPYLTKLKHLFNTNITLLQYEYVFLIQIRYISDPNEPQKIGMNGVVKLLEELQLDASSRLVLLLAWKMKAATQCEFTKEEFFNGMTEMGYGNITFYVNCKKITFN